MRISYLLRMYKNLHALFPDNAVAGASIRKQNTGKFFGGGTVINLMPDPL